MRKFFCFIVALAILSGCASMELKVEDIQNGPPLPKKAGVETPKVQGPDLMILPYQSLGVEETEAVKSGKVYCIRGFLSDVLFGEYFPGRIRWNAWVVQPDGQEGFAQATFHGLDPSGRFTATIISDIELNPGSTVVVLSTVVSHIYSLAGFETQVETKKFLENRAYRQKMVRNWGTKVGDWSGKRTRGLPFKGWNRYQTPTGFLLSPIGEKELKEIAGINPRYTFSEKLVATGNFTLVADPYGILIGISLDVVRALGAGSAGWDYSSELANRRLMGATFAYLNELRRRILIQQHKGQKPEGGNE